MVAKNACMTRQRLVDKNMPLLIRRIACRFNSASISRTVNTKILYDLCILWCHNSEGLGYVGPCSIYNIKPKTSRLCTRLTITGLLLKSLI